MDTIKIKCNDNIERIYPKGTTYYEISKDYHSPNPILGVRIYNDVFPLAKEAKHDADVTFIDVDDLIGNKIYKSALKYICEIALFNYNKTLEISFEHSVPKGLLGVIKGDKVITEQDAKAIKAEMLKIVESDLIIEKLNVKPREAIKYYQNTNQYEKAENIQNINDKAVALYKLQNHLNYFYTEMPYSTGAINKFDLVYLGNNQIVLLFPKIGDHGKLPEYVHYEKIIKAYADGKKWLDALGVPYVTDINDKVANGEIKKFIQSNELTFSLNISKIAAEINNRKDVKFVLIAGPSSSGKTTTNERLGAYLNALGYDTINISLDDYFKNRDETPLGEDGKPNFETLDAIDVNKFNEDINDLLNGEEITLPRYNFITGKREVTTKKLKLKDNSILLIEGLHALNNKLMLGVDKRYKYKIYLSPFIPINIDRHNYISTLDLRLLRRIVRDNRTRGYNVNSTIDNWQRVRDGEEKYIFPFIQEADVIVNTALAYEVGVLKVYIEPLLYSVKIDSKYYAEARRLISFLKQFYTIPGEYVNDNSILREFIGGKNND